MRRNLPVTQNEVQFPEGKKLISSTDLQGNVLHCNDAFEQISGYSRDELIGQPHNLIRHPDMPPEVSQVMWDMFKSAALLWAWLRTVVRTVTTTG